jgi:hypothetical protein
LFIRKRINQKNIKNISCLFGEIYNSKGLQSYKDGASCSHELNPAAGFTATYSSSVTTDSMRGAE